MITLPSIGIAQTAGDVFACAKAGMTFGKLKDHLEASSWDAPRPERSDLLAQLIFLGNVDATDPATWSDTADWARDLAIITTDRPYAIYAVNRSAVLLEQQKNDTVACLFVSDDVLVHQFQTAFPQLKLHSFDQREFGWFDQPDLKVSVAFIHRPTKELAAASEGRRSSATIVNKTASTTEDQK